MTVNFFPNLVSLIGPHIRLPCRSRYMLQQVNSNLSKFFRPLPGSFFFLFSIQLRENKNCQWLDSNHGYLVSESTSMTSFTAVRQWSVVIIRFTTFFLSRLVAWDPIKIFSHLPQKIRFFATRPLGTTTTMIIIIDWYLHSIIPIFVSSLQMFQVFIIWCRRRRRRRCRCRRHRRRPRRRRISVNYFLPLFVSFCVHRWRRDKSEFSEPICKEFVLA